MAAGHPASSSNAEPSAHLKEPHRGTLESHRDRLRPKQLDWEVQEFAETPNVENLGETV